LLCRHRAWRPDEKQPQLLGRSLPCRGAALSRHRPAATDFLHFLRKQRRANTRVKQDAAERPNPIPPLHDLSQLQTGGCEASHASTDAPAASRQRRCHGGQGAASAPRALGSAHPSPARSPPGTPPAPCRQRCRQPGCPRARHRGLTAISARHRLGLSQRRLRKSGARQRGAGQPIFIRNARRRYET